MHSLIFIHLSYNECYTHLSLVSPDLMVAAVNMPVALVTLVRHDWVFSRLMCDLNAFTVGCGFMVSVHTLLWIRYATDN